MIPRIVIQLIVAITCCSCGAAFGQAPEDVNKLAKPGPGRYKIATYGRGRLMHLDTKTGSMWYRQKESWRRFQEPPAWSEIKATTIGRFDVAFAVEKSRVPFNKVYAIDTQTGEYWVRNFTWGLDESGEWSRVAPPPRASP